MRKVLSGSFLSIFLWSAIFLPPARGETVVYQGVMQDLFQENLLENVTPVPYEKGVRYSLTLHQKTPAPIFMSAESRSDGVPHGGDSNYSLYIDAVYEDGTSQWGVVEPFSASGKWEKKSLVFFPEKPIRLISAYLLFRNMPGQVEFRNPFLAQAALGKVPSFFNFDGTPVMRTPSSTTSDTIRFYLNDLAHPDQWLSMEKKEDSNTFHAAGISLEVTPQSDGSVTHQTLQIRNNLPKERCLTLVCVLPISTQAKTAFRQLEPPYDLTGGKLQEVSYTRRTLGGKQRLSRLPLLGVAEESGETFLGIHPDFPALFRLFYNPTTQELCLAYDLAFLPEKNSWELRFCHFQQKTGGMRRAWNTYMKTFPDAFEVRLPIDEKTGKKTQGVWMPFASISKVPQFEDFGFRFKEGDGEPRWDQEHDILTFRYTEPMTWWMKLEELAEGEDCLAAGIRQVRKLQEKKHPQALAWETSVMHDAEGKPVGRYLDTPWCKGIVWSMNSIPGIPTPSDFSHKWNPAIQEKNISPDSPMDGEYIDSSEGYVTAELDFRRENMLVAKAPLTFDWRTQKPAMLRGLVTWEYMRAIAKDVHAHGKSMMANATPIALFWLTPLMDVLGTETNWNPNGQWSPMSPEELRYRRMLCGQKPYCFLMNTDFEHFSYECSEKFMKRTLAFGMFPGYFSHNASEGHYFTRPELYERDRPLFKKYIPLCKKLAEAGWESETLVAASDTAICVERFGKTSDETFYITLFNPTEEEKTFTLQFSEEFPASRIPATERYTLKPEDVQILEFSETSR
ncbi:MAG: hypothetical protein Q4D62_09930 [Planctomycetia bacterium]|nr:hypothetical protein [Planctomycetia bacterium]